jgi:hypothetical protein
MASRALDRSCHRQCRQTRRHTKPAPSQAKSRINPQIRRAGRQAGAIIRPSGRFEELELELGQFTERAWSGLLAVLQQQEASWAECTCAGTLISISLSFSVARVPQSCLPHAARRGAAHRSATQGLGKRALCLSSSLSIQFTVSKTFTSCDSRPCS